MNPTLHSRWNYPVLALLLALCTSASAQTAPANDQTSASPNDEAATPNDKAAVQLGTFTVTGSNIPTAADAVAVPVVVIGQLDIEQTGQNANVLEILRESVPAFAGRSNAGNSNATNTNQNTAGGSQIALRNLDTLVLINGRRAATSGINGVGGKSFVDVNQIPTAAIERIEVLTDGSSAIYGSDAIGGVVNIILKSDYQGGEIGGRYAATDNTGHYSEHSAYLVAGAKQGGTSITVTGSWSKTDPLRQYQRSFINPNLKSGTNFPGYVAGNFLAPGVSTPNASNAAGSAASLAALVANGTYLAAGSSSIPLFDAAPYLSMLLRQEQKSAVASFSSDLAGKKLVVFGDYLWSDVNNFNQTSSFLGNLRAVTVPAGAPYNPVAAAVPGVVVGSVDTPLQTYNHAKGGRLTLGFHGEINKDWNWEVGYTNSDNRLVQRLVNEAYVPNVLPAIAGGYDAAGNAVVGGKYSKVVSLSTGATVYQPALDPFARSGRDPASLANVYGTEIINVKSMLESYDAKLVGALFDLPGGKVGLAVGAAERKETLAGTPDNNSYNLSTDPTKHNWGPGTFFDPFSRNRTIDSVYAEVRVPLAGEHFAPAGLHAFDLTLAGRNEKYSDAGKSNVPKIGFRYQPFDDQLTIRFTYSKSFTAPTLYAMFGPPSVSLATADLFYNNLGIADTRLKGVTYYSGNGNNAALQPSTAQSRSLGAVFSPKGIKGLSLTLNYVNVFQKGLPAGIGAGVISASVNSLGSASPYFSGIAIGNMYGQPGASQALLASPQGLYNYIVSSAYNKDIYITDHFINSGGVHVQALDWNIEYAFPTSTYGKFTLSNSGTYQISFQAQDLPTTPWYEYAGYSTNGKTMSGTLPRYSAYTTLVWTHHAWSALLGNNFIPSMTDIGSGSAPAVYLATNAATKVSSYSVFDAQLSYTFDKSAAKGLVSYLKGMKVTLGVNNLANRMPPLAPKSQPPGSNNNNVDVSAYSPIGRLAFVSASIKF